MFAKEFKGQEISLIKHQVLGALKMLVHGSKKMDLKKSTQRIMKMATL
jgi:hypothetical protein